MSQKFIFEAKPWLYSGESAWHFVTLPTDIADEINFRYAHLKRGFGSLKVKVKTGGTNWETSIFPDKKSDSFLLPLKKSVREAEGIVVGKSRKFEIEIE